MPTPRRLARIAGLLYLIMGVCGAFAEIVRVTVYKAGDAATTAANVATHAGLVRASVVADLVAVPTGLFTAMALYLLLKHVHANAARTMVAFLAVAAAMMALNLAHQYQALQVSDAAYPGAFSGQGSDALVLLMLDLHHYGYLMTQVFFGLWLLPMGYLVYRSGMIPRVIGILLAVGCFGYLVDTFARFTAPDLGAALSPYVVTPAAVAEVSMMLWLLIKGVKVPQPDRPAALADTVNPYRGGRRHDPRGRLQPTPGVMWAPSMGRTIRHNVQGEPAQSIGDPLPAEAGLHLPDDDVPQAPRGPGELPPDVVRGTGDGRAMVPANSPTGIAVLHPFVIGAAISINPQDIGPDTPVRGHGVLTTTLYGLAHPPASDTPDR